MIQELLGGGASLINGGERKKISINGTILESPSSTTTTITNTTSSPNTNNSSTTTPPSTSENLRCPRCDSPNTKFCYYNNYNLTQPRHFCKTCRRYWTKGGALRNVPIGGGCRKNRSPMISSPSSFGKSNVAVGKLKAVASGFDNHELASSSIMWGPPQNSHILALLRAANHQNPNPNMLSNPNPKEEVNSFGIHHHMINDHHRAVSELDSLSHSQVPFWKSQQQNGFMASENPHQNNNNGLQDLYQRLRSTANYYDPPSINGNNNSMLSSSSSMLDSSAPVAGGELGYWNNSAFSSWSTDLPTINGAYP